MTSTFQIRKAKLSDAGDLAILDDIASHGLASWLWQGAVFEGQSDTALESGRERMFDQSPFGYQNAHVAHRDNIILGSIIDYPMIFEDPLSSMGPVADPVLKASFELMRSIDGNWYIDSLAVFTAERCQGIARGLLEVARTRAIENGKPAISLITQDDNAAALSLYQNSGFSIVDRRPFVPFSDNSKTKEWLLLSEPIM